MQIFYNCKLPSSLIIFHRELSQITLTDVLLFAKESIAKPLFRWQKMSFSVIMCFIIIFGEYL